MTLRFDQDEQTGLVRTCEEVTLPLPFGLGDYRVPAGFVSDGQSAPRGVWWLVGPPIRSPFMRCWIGHDHACNHSHGMFTRAIADALLGYWLILYGATALKATTTFWACFTYGRVKFLRRNGWS